jgi:hypothetical protein
LDVKNIFVWEGDWIQAQSGKPVSYVRSSAPRIESGDEILWAVAEKFVAMLKLEHRYFCLGARSKTSHA